MHRSLLAALSPLLALPPLALASLAFASCGDYPEIVNSVDDHRDAGVDAPPQPPPDAAPPEDASPPMLGPSLAFDDLHVATLQEGFHAFALLGGLVNEQLKMSVQNGTLLVGVELRDLDDPSGANDDAVAVAMIGLSDSDGDPANNWDPDAPETFSAAALSFGMAGNPTLEFKTASIKDGLLHAESVDALMTPGLPLPFMNPVLEGKLTPTTQGDAIRTLEEGRLSGAVPASLLALAPNITMGTCKGQTLLDVIATGCGFLAVQPDIDLDGDGLEKFFDDVGEDPDAGPGEDGRIDRCVDGDGTEILGTDCASDPRIADGYRLIFAVHGVRAIVLAP